MRLKMKSRYWVVVIIIPIIFIGLASFLVVKKEAKKQVDLDYQYQAMTPRIISYHQGDKRWDIIADRVLQPKEDGDDKKESKIILSNIKEARMFKEEQVEYELDAKQVIYFNTNKDIHLKGDVKLSQIEGEEIITQRLDWIDKKREFRTDMGVEVNLGDGHLTAKRMTIDTDNNFIDFSDNVEMEFEIVEGEANEK